MSMFRGLIGCGVVALLACPLPAQSLTQRIDQVRRDRAMQQYVQQQVQSGQRVQRGLAGRITDTPYDQMTARQAFDWLATVTDVPLVINWDRLAEEGIDAEQQVTLPIGQDMTGERALNLLIKQIQLEDNLLWEASAWYVELLTKSMANSRTTIVTYPIGDLLHHAPHFNNAPDFDLSVITDSAAGGSSGGGGGGDIFGDTREDVTELTKTEQARRITEVITRTVEPDIWRSNGGRHATITYFNEMLIVRAPAYVHRQIGSDPRMHPAVMPRQGQAVGIGAALPNPQVDVVNTGSLLDVTGTVDHTGRYVNFTTGLNQSTVTNIRQISPLSVQAPATLDGRPYRRQLGNVNVDRPRVGQ